MIIYELTKPGDRLSQSNDISKNFELENLIRHLIDTFFEANVALNLYLGEKQNSNLYFQRERENRDSDLKLKSEIREKIELEYPSGNNFEKFDEINYKAEIEFKKQIWNKGRVPSDLKNKLIFIHAKTFLYALDNFEKQLKKLLKNQIIPESCNSFYIKLIEHFPNLRELRNSTHHQEDRIRGERFGKKIDLKPISNRLIHAPKGGVLIMNSLNGDNYGGTLGDGTFGEVEVSIDSMNKLQSILQEFINSLDWKGNKEHLPK